MASTTILEQCQGPKYHTHRCDSLCVASYHTSEGSHVFIGYLNLGAQWMGEPLLFVQRCGFLKLLQQALRVRPDGLAAFGIPCGSYIFLNCPTHCRTPDNPFGNENLGYASTANMLHPKLDFKMCNGNFSALQECCVFPKPKS